MTSLTMSGFVLVFICTLLNSAGQILLKKFSISFDISLLGTWSSLLSGVLSPPVYRFLLPGISCYIIGIVLWVLALRSTPLYVAYPVIGLSFLLVPMLSNVFIGEPLSLRTVLGGLVIIGGIAITSTAYQQ